MFATHAGRLLTSCRNLRGQVSDCFVPHRRVQLHPPTPSKPLREHAAPAQSATHPDHTFNDVDALLDFVTLRWRERWVMTDIWDAAVVDALLKRPFFLLISVHAPAKVQWQRYHARCTATGMAPPSLLEFVGQNDEHQFAPDTGLSWMTYRAQLHLLNSTDSIDSLRAAIRQLDLTDEARLRPSWDQYFMQLADLAALRSNCMKRRVGCCIVRDKRVISTGYNGTPRGMTNCNEGGCMCAADRRRKFRVLTNFRSSVQPGRKRRLGPLDLSVSSCRRERAA